MDDRATLALMLLFYQQYWHQGQPPLAALRLAQLELHRNPARIEEVTMDRGLEFLDPIKLSTNPARLWAAWIVSGVTRPELEQMVKTLPPR